MYLCATFFCRLATFAHKLRPFHRRYLCRRRQDPKANGRTYKRRQPHALSSGTGMLKAGHGAQSLRTEFCRRRQFGKSWICRPQHRDWIGDPQACPSSDRIHVRAFGPRHRSVWMGCTVPPDGPLVTFHVGRTSAANQYRGENAERTPRRILSTCRLLY